MTEYYKVSLLRETDYGGLWDKIYLGVKNGNPDDLLFPMMGSSYLDLRVEEIGEDEMLDELMDWDWEN